MEKRLIRFCLLFMIFPGLLCAQEAGIFPLRPGSPHPEPRQRSLTQIESIPTRTEICPVCGRTVHVPLLDTLMQSRDTDGQPVKWQMHAASRDADMAPFPGKNKVAFQGDLVVCPDCGLSLPADRFGQPLPDELIAWATATLKPHLRQVQTALLGKRAGEMSEEQIIEFFNRQEEIPDLVRTEHYRIYTIAADRPFLEQAEATWLAAWALRRESAGPMKGKFLAAHQNAVEGMLEKKDNASQAARMQALVRLIGKTRSGKDRLQYDDKLAAQILLSGEQFRMGLYREGAKTMETIRNLARDRFLRPEQDPLWPFTSTRAAKSYRLQELETIRSETENELSVKLDQSAQERELLGVAAGLVRQGILADEVTDRDNALFYAYLVGEFLRRHGEFPLASEWFENVRNLATAGTPVAEATARQLALLHEQAADVNLLAGLGQDGEAFEKLREICARPGAAAEQP